MLDGSEHQITNVLAADAARGGEETHGLAITDPERARILDGPADFLVRK
jgi:hypothetical protein